MSTQALSRSPRTMAIKVPEVTALFWIAKLLTTGIGEACSDYLYLRHGAPGTFVGGVVFLAAMAWQLSARSYRPVVYWFAVLMVAVFGTSVADVIHLGFGVPYAISTPAFAIILAAVFVVWYKTEGTLSIHSIDTRRRELFYWAAVCSTFAMGTALGDLTAFTLHLGFLTSAFLFLVLFALPAVAFFALRMNAIACFWVAYVLTRPLGASFADWFGKPGSLGGLGYGEGTITIIGTVIIAGVVVLLAREHRANQAKRASLAEPAR